ncbi:hypothetical protein [Shewanella waksmanii]|uniref:hypothetical protein n=1 Tax=Shewanella waksmanii TaxID=213783 RepID=UPI00048AD03E|nr:hypothetical protein [Shewanella waksmanii]
MSNSISLKQVNFSGKMALFAAIIFGLAATSQVKAEEFTAAEQAAIDHHHAILDQQQAVVEDAIMDEQQAELEQQIEQQETAFMHETCADYGRDYDEETEVCYE